MVICDGSLPALIAVANEVGAAEPPLLWSAPSVGDDAERVASSIESIASSYSLERVAGLSPEAPVSEHDRQDRMLVAAAHAAMSLGCSRLVWPIQFGGHSTDAWPELDSVAIAVDRAVLVARLAGLAASEHGLLELSIETPFVDLTDEQIADLAVDLAIPAELCWWWAAPSESANTESDRWLQALEHVGWKANASTAGNG